MLDQAVLDALWDYGDPAGSEARFRLELEQQGWAQDALDELAVAMSNDEL